jgi:hypothetical protein
MKSIVKYIFIIAVLGEFLLCIPKQNNFDERYNTTLLLSLALTPSDANAMCVSVSKKQTECLEAPAVALGITLPVTEDATYVKECTDILKSSQFNNMSAIAQTCVLTCQETDWKTKISSGECKTGTASSLVASTLTNTVVTRCIRSCFSATNGQVSEADITKLLIFNFIQNGD